MVAILAFMIFLLQGIPVQQGGKVTGVLRDSFGVPRAGVRMAAVSRGATLEETAAGVSMAGLAQTDENGRFTLEDIPPGRYSIAAGRLDLQTYHPGTQRLSDATILTVTAGETISGINFTLNSSSIGRASPVVGGTPPVVATIPVRVTVENGGKLPVTANGKSINLRLEYASNSLTIPIDATSFRVTGPVIADVRVVIENLPEHYEVKSVVYGSQVLPQRVFRLTNANFSTVSTVAVPTPTAIPSSPPPPANPQAPQYEQALVDYLRSRVNALVPLGLLSSNSPITFVTTTTVPAATPPSNLSITIGDVLRPKAPGVRVAGQTGGKDRRMVYISGRPGVVFSDGTFEFRGVPPGRHLIASMGTSGRSAAVVVVGNNDIGGVELKPALLLPSDATEPKAPLPVGDLAPGTIVSLPRITGSVLEETSKTPITEGEVVIRSGNFSRNVPIDDKGRFETFTLFPGTYDLRLQIFGHSTIGPTVTVGDKDIDLEVPVRRLY